MKDIIPKRGKYFLYQHNTKWFSYEGVIDKHL